VLLLDGYLRPGLAGVTLPFALGYRPFWTGRGVIGGWLALIFAASFYVRRWIGVKSWRWLRRWRLAVYLLALADVVGAGADGVRRDARAVDGARRPGRVRARLPDAARRTVHASESAAQCVGQFSAVKRGRRCSVRKRTSSAIIHSNTSPLSLPACLVSRSDVAVSSSAARINGGMRTRGASLTGS
jgi:hypothetical protein